MVAYAFGGISRLRKSKIAKEKNKKKIVIIGAGAAGLSIAARLARKAKQLAEVILVEPSKVHYYQPGFTYIGFGKLNPKLVSRPMQDLIPKGVKWIQNKATGIDPITQTVTLSHKTIQYDQLVIATGLELLWDKVIGLRQALGDPDSGVISVCSLGNTKMAWEKVRKFSGGKILSTMPNTETKCPGVLQKVLFLMCSIMKRLGGHCNFFIFSPKTDCAIGQPYRGYLEGELMKMETEINYESTLIEIRPAEKIAIFQKSDGRTYERSFDLLHVVPPMAAPDFLSNLADETGFVTVDPKTLQHKKYSNIFAAGDCAGIPTRKTAAAARKQGPLLVENLISIIKGEKMTADYNGYSCCPVPIVDGKILMMEFGYAGVMPGLLNKLVGVRPSRIMHFIKKHVIPKMYWHAMLKGIKI